MAKIEFAYIIPGDIIIKSYNGPDVPTFWTCNVSRNVNIHNCHIVLMQGEKGSPGIIVITTPEKAQYILVSTSLT